MLILFFVNFDFAVLEYYHSTYIPSVFADKHVHVSKKNCVECCGMIFGIESFKNSFKWHKDWLDRRKTMLIHVGGRI